MNKRNFVRSLFSSGERLAPLKKSFILHFWYIPTNWRGWVDDLHTQPWERNTIFHKIFWIINFNHGREFFLKTIHITHSQLHFPFRGWRGQIILITLVWNQTRQNTLCGFQNNRIGCYGCTQAVKALMAKVSWDTNHNDSCLCRYGCFRSLNLT